MIRQPVGAGMFYSEEQAGLKSEIEHSFRNAKDSLRITGGIVPHAGYMFSGPCAAHVYSCVRATLPKPIIILGFSHRRAGRGLSISMKDWKTPLGTASIDTGLAQKLKKVVNTDEEAHAGEHSIEVQLPFLQYISDNIRFLPISVGPGVPSNAAKALADTGACILASTDFTHYGPRFGYMPFKNDIEKNLSDLDMGAVSFIQKLDSKGFLDYVKQTGATICGSSVVALMIDIMKERNAKPRLLDYYTSARVAKDENSVSYVGMVFE